MQNLSTYDERLAALEQTSVTRTELTKAIDNLTLQYGRTLRDRNHEVAISLGILTDDVRIIKENVASIRVSLTDLSQELYAMDEKFEKRFVSMDEKFEKRFNSLETRFDSLETRFSEQTVLLTQILARLPEKP